MTQTALNAITSLVDSAQLANLPEITTDSGNVSFDINLGGQADTAQTKSDTAATASGDLTKTPMTLAATEDHVDKEGIFSRGFKYMVLILLNMLIFHFCGRTIGVMGGVEKPISFKSYLKSQVRLLQVGILSWGGEIVFGIGASILCGIFFNEGVESILKKIIEMFFLGYFFFDGYYDYKGYKIKEAWKGIIEHAAPVIITGAVTLLLLMLPYVGYFLSAYFCSVAATLYLIGQEGQTPVYAGQSKMYIDH
ncbi:MAG: hypothetical protein IPN29_07230 [Saprospiraceae bacterium]|nr:hypothetical protein [Saprospiraceae bacterium]